MLSLKKAAVTGGLSSGKSTVCQIFKGLGAHVISADTIVHQLLSPNSSLGQEVIKLLGAEIVINQTMDRKIIADKVFNNPQLLNHLEKLLHPAVLVKMKNEYQIAKSLDVSLFVAEVPLLFESGQDAWFDVTIAVKCAEDIQLQRFKKKTGKSDKEYRLRMRRQLTSQQKVARANYIVSNDGDFASLEEKVIYLYKNLTQS